MIEQIVSGGQTGADRAALDFALARRIPHTGWCPKGRLAEDGPLPIKYRLMTTPSEEPAQRTAWNVRDSDGTVIFSLKTDLEGGSEITANFCMSYHKPWLRLVRTDGTDDELAARLLEFTTRHALKTLNVAGPRESKEPGVGKFVRDILERWFQLATAK